MLTFLTVFCFVFDRQFNYIGRSISSGANTATGTGGGMGSVTGSGTIEVYSSWSPYDVFRDRLKLIPSPSRLQGRPIRDRLTPKNRITMKAMI